MRAVTDLRYHVFQTSLGWASVLASGRGLRRMAVKSSPGEAVEALGPLAGGAMEDPLGLGWLKTRLERYLETGEGLEDIPLDLEGAPPFFRAAWEACRRIPRGETRSYGWLAREAGSPRAVRAAGQAMARNPLSLVIPCHRVVGGDGSLRGYGGGYGQGLDMKARLLILEGALEWGSDGRATSALRRSG